VDGVTEAELRRMARHYQTSSAIRTELALLRRQFPKLLTLESQRQNLQDRAVLHKLLLRVKE